MSAELHAMLKARSQVGLLKWSTGLAWSAAFHGLVALVMLWPSKNGSQAETTKVTWVTLPARGQQGQSGGSQAAEVGKQGERLRRVEEVAPQAEKPEPKTGPAITPNAFGRKVIAPVKGTNLNQDSMGKAPVASKGKEAAANPVTGAAGKGGGGGIGEGTGIPGLKASGGVSGGTGIIGDLDGDFPFVWYLEQVQNTVTANWNRMGGGQGRVQVYFRILQDGRVEGARIESPSGNSALDQSALMAVKRSSPLPKLPNGFEGSSLGVHFWFSYLGQ